MEPKEQTFKCTGDCMRCSVPQRQYCSAQFTYNTLRMVEDLSAAVDALQNTVDSMKGKIDVLQGNDTSIFNPTKEPESENPTESSSQVGKTD